MNCLCSGLTTVKNFLCCSRSSDDGQPLAASSSGGGESNISISSNLALEFDLGIPGQGLGDDIITTPVAGSAKQWRPKLELQDSGHWNSGYTDGDLGDGQRVFPEDEVDGPRRGEPAPGSRTTTRESGYGMSLDETPGTSPLPHVHIIEPRPNTTIYKVVLQTKTRCWFVLRRLNEFLRIQDTIQRMVGGVVLPTWETTLPSRDDLDAFIVTIMSDARILALVEVREFLALDRYRADSSSSSSDGSNSVTLLDPRLLCAPPAPQTYRKNLNPVPLREKRRASHDYQEVPLGCKEETKIKPSDFEFLSVIGKGSFGRVMLARYKSDNKIYAVKILNKKMIVNRNETAHVLSERSVLIKMMNHPYLVQLHFAFTTISKIFFVLDYINGGELFFHLQRERIFPEARARFYAAEICCAMCYMHEKGIVYRDLKPENILLDDEGHIVLTDFGLCKEGLQSSQAKTGTFCGTPEYLAPEILKKQPYSRSVDWWTLGAVMYEMMYGLPPFYSRDSQQMYDAILNKPLRLKHSISRRARELLNGLLQKNPADRLGSSNRDGLDVKSQSFFEEIDWSLVEKRGMTPPFVPVTGDEADTRNIDPMFTREAVLMSPGSEDALKGSVMVDDNIFKGFSYAPPIEEENF